MTTTAADNPKKRRFLPFGALKDKDAEQLADTLKKAREAHGGPLSVVFTGQWKNRRFVIDNIHPADVVTMTPIRNLDAGTLTLPILPANDSATYTNALRGFGMSIEIAERKRRPGFDVVVGPDGETHRVRESHHIAACGLRGPWTDEVLVWSDGASVDSISLTCVACEKSRVDAQSVSGTSLPVPVSSGTVNGP